MNGFKILLLAVSISLYGCAGIGVFSSSDPEVKISDARYLMRNPPGRPFLADRLIHEAIGLCKANNSSECLGNAYNAYGWFYMAESVSFTYGREGTGFWDTGATYDTRYQMSEKYFKKAEALQKVTLIYDDLTNTYFGLATLYSYYLKKPKLACEALTKSVAAYKENIKTNPKAGVQVPDGYSDFGDIVSAERKRSGCAK